MGLEQVDYVHIHHTSHMVHWAYVNEKADTNTTTHFKHAQLKTHQWDASPHQHT